MHYIYYLATTHFVKKFLIFSKQILLQQIKLKKFFKKMKWNVLLNEMNEMCYWLLENEYNCETNWKEWSSINGIKFLS